MSKLAADVSSAPRVPLDAAGMCSWAIQLSDERYVYSVIDRSAGYSLDAALVWLSYERAVEVAAKTPWIGASARIVRAKP